jgi:hypothetical protein
MWQESNQAPEGYPPVTTTCYCKFKGNTLASCSNRPTTVYPHFIGQDRATLASLPEDNTWVPNGLHSRWILDEESILPPTSQYSPRLSDMNLDGVTNFKDFATMANKWKNSPGTIEPNEDIFPWSGDGHVDSNDLSVMCGYWLQ